MDTEKFFPPSNPLHDEPDQLKRQKGALKLNVQFVDTATGTGKINDYDVSLDSCSCIDFSRRGVPCKHMYRLAHELDIFKLEGKVVNAPSIHNCKDEQDGRNALKKIISALPKRSQEILQECVSLHARCFDISSQLHIQPLADAGLLSVRSITFEDIATQFTIADILELCTDEKPSNATRRKPVIEFFLKHYPEKVEHIMQSYTGGRLWIDLSPTLETNLVAVARFLAKLLGRIYRMDFDEEGNYIEGGRIVRGESELSFIIGRSSK